MNYSTPIDLTYCQKSLSDSLSNVVVLDIGGSLAKLAYVAKYQYTSLVPQANEDINNPYNYQTVENEGFRICFVKFETNLIDQCLEFIKNKIFNEESQNRKIKVTGGGAYKFVQLIEEKLNIQIEKLDEIYCIVKGCEFVLANIPDESYTYNKKISPCKSYQSSMVNTYPFLLVNIGSGVSIIKVDGPDSYQRLGGTSIGGGTFWGIGSLLTNGKYTFDELLSLTEKGDHRNVDMLVKDIYGHNYDKLGLRGDIIASSFGLTARNPNKEKTEADMLKSLLITVSNNIGQLAYLYAKIHDLTKIYFGGFFIRNHSITMESISYGVNFWSQGSMKALFLRHEGYLGAVGAFSSALNDHLPKSTKSSFSEHFKIADSQVEIKETDNLSASQPNDEGFTTDSLMKLESLQLNYVHTSFSYFPLLTNAQSYDPDTWQISQDEEARNYWIESVERLMNRFQRVAVQSQDNSDDAIERGKKFNESFSLFLRDKKLWPSEKGAFTIRGLIDALLQYLTAYDFPDPFMHQKKIDNCNALSAVAERLAQTKIADLAERHFNIFQGVFAGNVFDWGSSEAIHLFEKDDTEKFIGMFDKTCDLLQKRPWLVDNFDEWIVFFKEKRDSLNAVLIFVDNSGPDLLLGILPLVIELLACRNGQTKVIIAANKEPSINDVTIDELKILIENISLFVDPIREALTENRLILTDNGHSSPFLDFRVISSALSNLIEKESIDLIILEGMGRSIHTNLYATFKVPSLKLAVIKNSWIAKKLGGDLFSVVLKFEQ